jgi:hypothetical protein
MEELKQQYKYLRRVQMELDSNSKNINEIELNECSEKEFKKDYELAKHFFFLLEQSFTNRITFVELPCKLYNIVITLQNKTLTESKEYIAKFINAITYCSPLGKSNDFPFFMNENDNKLELYHISNNSYLYHALIKQQPIGWLLLFKPFCL